MNPWPCAFTSLDNMVYKIHKVSIVDCNLKGKVGEIVSSDKNGLIVACGKGFLSIDVIQAPNAKKMCTKDYLLGHKISTGSVFE